MCLHLEPLNDVTLACEQAGTGVASPADILRRASRVPMSAGETRTRDEPLRTSAWEATRVPAPRTRDELSQPRSQGSLLPVPTERVGERTWERGWWRTPWNVCEVGYYQRWPLPAAVWEMSPRSSPEQTVASQGEPREREKSSLEIP